MGREVALGRRQGNLDWQRAFVWWFWGGRGRAGFLGERELRETEEISGEKGGEHWE